LPPSPSQQYPSTQPQPSPQQKITPSTTTTATAGDSESLVVSDLKIHVLFKSFQVRRKNCFLFKIVGYVVHLDTEYTRAVCLQLLVFALTFFRRRLLFSGRRSLNKCFRLTFVCTSASSKFPQITAKLSCDVIQIL